jgi:tRNA threonylcarbamoyladenosine biosynthesis protein TsaB
MFLRQHQNRFQWFERLSGSDWFRRKRNTMRILAIETTDKTGTVAAVEDGNLLADLELDHNQRSAQSLAPALHETLKQAGWRPNDVQLVAVTVGPGSFTGLRVGVTTAKVFAYAVGAEVLGIDTLETIAAAAPVNVQSLWAAMDAQRGDVVARLFVRSPGTLWFEPSGCQELLPLNVWLGRLTPGSVVAGPMGDKMARHMPAGVTMLAPSCALPRASQVARLAARDYAAGRRDDLWKLLPRYLRRSAAEEKWDALCAVDRVKPIGDSHPSSQ